MRHAKIIEVLYAQRVISKVVIDVSEEPDISIFRENVFSVFLRSDGKNARKYMETQARRI
jgi:hypothetical protein